MPEQIDGDPSDQIAISRAEYEQLVADAAELRRLEAAGVDNWEGY